MSKEKPQLNDIDLLILDDPVKACLWEDTALASCEFAIKEYYDYENVTVSRPTSSYETWLTVIIITDSYRCISAKTTYVTKKDMIGIYSYYLHFIGKL